MKLPKTLVKRFTMDGKIPIGKKYFDESKPKKIILKMSDYNTAFRQLSEGTFKYYGKTLGHLKDALRNYPVKDKTVVVFGLTGVNCDAIALWNGAKEVFVVDYNLPVSEHPKVKPLSHNEFLESGIKADVGISISTFEHDGLGRYGDKINPDGDLEAMKAAKSFIKKKGLLFLAVPVGKDKIVWNAHRIYGEKRLPLLLEGWEILNKYGESKQPVFVLRSKDES